MGVIGDRAARPCLAEGGSRMGDGTLLCRATGGYCKMACIAVVGHLLFLLCVYIELEGGPTKGGLAFVRCFHRGLLSLIQQEAACVVPQGGGSMDLQPEKACFLPRGRLGLQPEEACVPIGGRAVFNPIRRVSAGVRGGGITERSVCVHSRREGCELQCKHARCVSPAKVWFYNPARRVCTARESVGMSITTQGGVCVPTGGGLACLSWFVL